LELWDTAGIERFATLSSSYFQNASAALLCYSHVDRESFNMLSQHILEIIMHSSTAKIFLCGNKLDLEEEDEIIESDVEAFSEQCDAVLSGTFTVSCKTGNGLHDMFVTIATMLQEEAAQKFDPSRIRPHEEPPELPPQKGHCCS
jgi:small GTP-binding protein